MTQDSKKIQQSSLIRASISFTFLYYRSLFAAFIKNTNPFHPHSIIDSLRMIRLIFKVRGHTAVWIPRLVALYQLTNEIDRRQVPGDIVECGVYNGGSAALMASASRNSPKKRRIWLFDSFQGLPQPTEQDGEKAQSCGWWCHGDLEMVVTIFHKLQIPDSRVNIIKGWFHDTFPSAEINSIALLHIDADWYDSVKLCLERFYDYVRPGGFIAIDDYGHWEGCRKAVDEFMEARKIDTSLTYVDYTGRYFRKPF